MGTLRYVKASGGLMVRNAAGGSTVEATLSFGDVMYDISTTTIPQALNGVVYNWRQVYFYRGHDTVEQGYGWVADEFTEEVPAAIPSVIDVISNDVALSMHQKLINARYIFQYFRNKRWRTNAIYAMLGNMETESYLNPGKWQIPNNTANGYGLTQWTPATKYINDWLITIKGKTAAEKGYINNQLERIEEEVAGIYAQWDSSKHSPTMTFSDFTKSNASVEVLAEYFLRCYEQPADINGTLEARKRNANKWSTLLDIIDY